MKNSKKPYQRSDLRLAEKKAFQLNMALKLRASVKEFLYCNSPLRNEFQVRPIEEGEIKIFENVKYARVLNENNTESYVIKNKNVVVPFFEIRSFYQDFENFSDKFKGFNKLICEEMLVQEEDTFKRLKKYLTKTRKGVLLIRSDVQMVCANDVSGTMGFSAFEQIGAVILNK